MRKVKTFAKKHVKGIAIATGIIVGGVVCYKIGFKHGANDAMDYLWSEAMNCGSARFRRKSNPDDIFWVVSQKEVDRINELFDRIVETKKEV